MGLIRTAPLALLMRMFKNAEQRKKEESISFLKNA
jgi:hypothetical protein